MVPEIYVLYIALVYHGILWSLVLRVLDHVKQGGSLKSIFNNENSVKENNDVIEDEDQDVKNERNLVKNYMERYYIDIICFYKILSLWWIPSPQ